MKDLGTVKGDYASVALGANERGEVVGLSIDKTGVPRAFLRRNGVMVDLNTLLQANAPIHALVAEIINARDEIVGFGVTSSEKTTPSWQRHVLRCAFRDGTVRQYEVAQRASVLLSGPARLSATGHTPTIRRIPRRGCSGWWLFLVCPF